MMLAMSVLYRLGANGRIYRIYLNLRRARLILFTLIALPSVGISAAEQRELSWAAGGHPNTHWSVLDALEQALSFQVNGDDLHSHQIALRNSAKQTFSEQAALLHFRGRLCHSEQAANDWARLTCGAYAIPQEKPPSSDCRDKRCTEIQLAPFIYRERDLLDVVRAAAANPCAFIPDYERLRARHRTKEPRGGITMHTANVSKHWLYCDTNRPVKGTLMPTATEGLYMLRWERPSPSTTTRGATR